MRYIRSILVGIGIGSFLLVIFTAIYYSAWMVITVLLQSGLQGLAATFIYVRLKFPYFAKFLLHAGVSYLLALSTLLANASVWQVSLWLFSIEWLLIFAVLWCYFAWSNYSEAKKINERLKK